MMQAIHGTAENAVAIDFAKRDGARAAIAFRATLVGATQLFDSAKVLKNSQCRADVSHKS
jgi:hypothetical protein